MWQDTILGYANITTFSSSKFYPKNSQLKSALDVQLKNIDKDYFDQKVLKVPIINLEKSGFVSLGNVWRGKASKKVDGLVVSLREIYKHRSVLSRGNEKLSAEERVAWFENSVSPEAWKLAQYLSVAGRTNVAIMQIVQKEMMPETSHIHLAECFTGGLLDKRKKQEYYQFYDGVDEILLTELGNYGALQTLMKCSDFIAEEIGSSLRFKALLHSGIAESQNMSKKDRIFAYMSAKTLRRLGGKYRAVAEKLDKKMKSTNKTKAIIPHSKRFQMGSDDGDDDEKPVHTVTFNYDFEIAPYPVTVGEFRTFVEETNYKTEAEKGDGAYVWDGKEVNKKKDAYWDNPYFEQTDEHPVVCVSWNDTQAYIKWLNKKTGNNYRLPTEAEWEYACRAGTTTKWSFGDDEKELDKYAWYNKNAYDKGEKYPDYETHPVGEKLPNPWGLYDMHGNVREWCEDWYVDTYKDTPRDGSANEKGEKTFKVLRGGSWSIDADWTRSAYRSWDDPVSRIDISGFRLLRTLP